MDYWRAKGVAIATGKARAKKEMNLKLKQKSWFGTWMKIKTKLK